MRRHSRPPPLAPRAAEFSLSALLIMSISAPSPFINISRPGFAPNAIFYPFAPRIYATAGSLPLLPRTELQLTGPRKENALTPRIHRRRSYKVGIENVIAKMRPSGAGRLPLMAAKGSRCVENSNILSFLRCPLSSLTDCNFCDRFPR